MKTFKSQLLGLILILTATININAQGVSAPFEAITINNSVAEEVIETTANKEISMHIEANLEYPHHLIEFDLKGTSLVRFRLNENGEIISKKIIKSIGSAFDKAIINSVKDLKAVSPIYKNGVPSAYAIVVPVRFQQ